MLSTAVNVFSALRDAPAMVAIRARSFVMGSPMGSDAGPTNAGPENAETEIVGSDNERPAHRVWVDAFQLAACQVTNAEYARFLSATNCAAPPQWNDANFNHPQQPVVAVSWFEAVWVFGLVLSV